MSVDLWLPDLPRVQSGADPQAYLRAAMHRHFSPKTAFAVLAQASAGARRQPSDRCEDRNPPSGAPDPHDGYLADFLMRNQAPSATDSNQQPAKRGAYHINRSKSCESPEEVLPTGNKDAGLTVETDRRANEQPKTNLPIRVRPAEIGSAPPTRTPEEAPKVTKSTFAVIVAAGAVALSIGLTGPAVADYQYWVPVCTGNDTPMNNACRTGGPQGTPLDSPLNAGTGLPAVSPGANPYIPIGVGN